MNMIRWSNVWPQVRWPGAAAVMLTTAVLCASTLVRIRNLNYNAPFTDEAIYIVLGRMGLFDRDFAEYNPQSWVGGSVYLYPIISAAAANLGGVAGSRFINVVLSIFALEFTYLTAIRLAQNTRTDRFKAGLISAVILGGSATGYYVSRIATHDMLSFLFFSMSLYYLVKALQTPTPNARLYFASAMLMAGAFLIKTVILVYIPPVIAFTYLRVRKNRKHRIFGTGYLIIPLALVTVGSLLISREMLAAFIRGHVTITYDTLQNFREVIWGGFRYILPFALLGSAGLISDRKYSVFAVLAAGTLWIIIWHLAVSRVPALDKHLYLSVYFMALIAGTGIPRLLKKLRPVKLKTSFYSALILILAGYFVVSVNSAARLYDNYWYDSRPVLSYMTGVVKNGDKVLAETGAPVIYVTYEKNHPINTVTFDWFRYGNSEGTAAYAEAVRDGYFDIIELESNSLPKLAEFSELHRRVASIIPENYRLIYENRNFYVYRRLF